MDLINYARLVIKVKDPSNHALIDEIVDALDASIDNSAISVYNQYSEIESNQKALDLLDLIFYVVIGIMMFLCFFALQASMTANMYE